MPDDVACRSAHAVAAPNGEVQWQSAAVDVEMTEGKNDENRMRVRFLTHASSSGSAMETRRGLHLRRCKVNGGPQSSADSRPQLRTSAWSGLIIGRFSTSFD